ncbi:urease accessory protein UreF [Thiosulfatimonas sediminis]|uniref:Urease accessory protein UreF n=1 Tax=Thiosulfatimonas sediminis TaxID=2675054 RepID=A0A6F8PT30_9GAMM|nr:urease accessory UreF family protein [Thiosulfatimonas sediminis]BBP45184.1 urease accessory protein UreF [Thiosulfatimonas sediminis]
MSSAFAQQQKLLRLLQLNSPSLPIGTYAYSQGLEAAVAQGLVADAQQAQHWLQTLLRHTLVPNDLALLVRAYHAWQTEDFAAITDLIAHSRALRETAELLQEDTHLAQALIRLAAPLEIPLPDNFARKNSLPIVYARFAQHWQISLEDSLTAFAWGWMENQIAALLKLCSLGQTQAQQLMLRMDQPILDAVQRAIDLPDDLVGMSLPNFAILSAQHEQQYSRLFRS